jgi:isocitrate lyase
MAKSHAELQKAVKNILEYYGWYVVENKKGGYNAGRYTLERKGIADLLAVKPFNNILWVEIKTGKDIQRPDQKEFEKEVTEKGHKYFLVYDIDKVKKVIEND